MRSSLASIDSQGNVPNADLAHTFAAAWSQLSDRDQRKALRIVIEEVSFDVADGIIAMSLTDDALQKLKKFLPGTSEQT